MCGFRDVRIDLHRKQLQELFGVCTVHLPGDDFKLLNRPCTRKRTHRGIKIICVRADENWYVVESMSLQQSLLSPRKEVPVDQRWRADARHAHANLVFRLQPKYPIGGY